MPDPIYSSQASSEDFFLLAYGEYPPLADSDAMLAHLNAPAVQEILPQLMGMAPLSLFEVYGELSAEAETAVADLAPRRFGSFTGFMR